MRLARLLAAAAVLAAPALPIAVAPTASALSCVGPELVMEDAEQVYVGRIVDADDGSILVAVAEVWRGGPVDDHVWLTVDLEEWAVWATNGEIPDGFSSPETWVFAEMPDLPDTVNPCSAFPEADAAAYRPAVVEQPVPVATDESGGLARDDEPRWMGVAGAAGGLVTLVAVAVLVARRRGAI